MNIADFLMRYANKKVDFDGVYGAQCVDLFRQYCKEVLEIPHTGSVVGAKDLYEKYDSLPLEKKYFKKTKKAVPGDIAVYGATKTNKYGHVAIVVGVNDDSNLVFEQDGFSQRGTEFKVRSNDSLLGYLHFTGK